ncbi:hypothetical protein GWK47_027901 [Chionoecetes opilio]|uniref:Ig-like domain-containing protein n=1 Tax=Chionoecetes opilio TaxID=41210 RepID=A0A8J4YMD5_CHIOP|nr:hypothetical protein GWK47_027901 [Chionoecetes opilio]
MAPFGGRIRVRVSACLDPWHTGRMPRVFGEAWPTHVMRPVCMQRPVPATHPVRPPFGSQVAYDDHYEYDEDPTGEEVSDYDEEYTTPDVLPVFTSKEQHFSVEVGGDITFPCQVENQGAHVVMFKHIHPDGEHRLLFVGAMALKQTLKLTKDGNSFKLSGVRRSHAGSYVCRIETSPAIEVTHTLDVQYPAKFNHQVAIRVIGILSHDSIILPHVGASLQLTHNSALQPIQYAGQSDGRHVLLHVHEMRFKTTIWSW